MSEQPMLTTRSARATWALAAAGLAWTAVVDFPAYRITGAIAARRRPDNRTGHVLMLVGWLLPFGRLVNYGGALPWTLAVALQWAWVVPLIYLVLTFPDARLTRRTDRVLVGLGAFDALVVQVAWMSVIDTSGCATCGKNLLFIHDAPALAARLDLASIRLGIALLVVVAARVLQRWARATVPGRRVLAPVITTGGPFVAAQTVQLVALLVAPDAASLRHALFHVTWLAAATVPLGFLVGLLRARARRARVGELLVELGELPPPDRFQDALRKALGDPSLVAGLWSPDLHGYVGTDGRPVRLPADDAGDVATFLDRGGEPLAVIVHDRALLDDPGLLAATTAAARLAIENEHLQREVLFQLAEVHASRARIVAAGDEARRRIERDLHDGAQQRLVALRFQLQMLESAVASSNGSDAQTAVRVASAELAAALADLRTLASGIHPMILSQDGLGAALESLAERSPVPVELAGLPSGRLPEPVEIAAYYVVSEALTNAAKHAHATRVQVCATHDGQRLGVTVADDGIGGADVSRGTGLRGIADRVAALDGSFVLTSSPGQGTIVRVELPCASPVVERVATLTR
ncbi:MAG: histidine kinase [Frankia sp.]|nr:histidine kinase [Frankia sp.]